MAGGETIERLRQYLRELPPQARALLIAEFERSLLRGDEGAGTDLVLQELRRVVRDQREGSPRIRNCARLFFKPLEPFLVDTAPTTIIPAASRATRSKCCGPGFAVTCCLKRRAS